MLQRKNDSAPSFRSSGHDGRWRCHSALTNSRGRPAFCTDQPVEPFNELQPVSTFQPFNVSTSFRCLCAIALALLATITISSAATLSNPQVDSYNVRIGTETFAGM